MNTETNQRPEHTPSPAGASTDNSETSNLTENSENIAAGDGCVARLVGCSSFIGSWLRDRTPPRKSPAGVGLCASDEANCGKGSVESSEPPGHSHARNRALENSESPQPPYCRRDGEAASLARDGENQEWPTDMLHTTIFGSPADFQTLLEVEASQGLLSRRESRMKQRLIGRETYLQVLYGARHSGSLILREHHLPSLGTIRCWVRSWWGRSSNSSNQRQSAPTGAQEPEFKQGADRPLGDASGCALFSGHCYYPEGGAEDFRAWGSIEELKKLYAANADKWSKDAAGSYADPWGQIVDMETMTIMLTIRGHGDWTQCHRAPKDETSGCADQSEIPKDQVLGEINWGGGKIVEYMIPNLTEEEKTEARKNWVENVERMGGVDNYLRNTTLYDLGVLLGSSPVTLKNTLNQP